jgi:hypothetical protein
MAVGMKFWHGNMVAKQVFPLSNNFTQHNETAEGICTAASLYWARACLRKKGIVDSWDEIGVSQHNLNIIMATLRKYDSNPAAQTGLVNLRMETGGDGVARGVKDVINAVKASRNKIAIFWNSYHTMGYGYSHHQKDLFDMNYGLFRSKYSKGIEAKIQELYGDDIIGYRLLELD